MTELLYKEPHRRYNCLTGEWVKVSPHRTQRPWNGKIEKTEQATRPEYDPKCYLCPGNVRAGGHTNPEYDDVFVFTNDFAALKPDTPEGMANEANGLIRAESERGICKVICFSPRHDLTLAKMAVSSIENVVNVWKDQYIELGAIDYIRHVQIFENRGDIMGCSNPHPHGQIWADERLPTLPAAEVRNQKAYYEQNGRAMLLDYLDYELKDEQRIITSNDSFVAMVPFWAVWPFEVMIVPRTACTSLKDMDKKQLSDLADMLKRVGIKYDHVFDVSFPYSMGLHQAPTDGEDYTGLQFHIHYMPPLLRSATVRKFMVGYELLAMAQRDITPEGAAETLRKLPETEGGAE